MTQFQQRQDETPASEQASDANSGGGHLPRRFNLLRCLLALYFLIYVYVVAHGLVPLPDQPPRIDFWGLLCITAGFVIAFHVMMSRYRLFWLSILVFIPFAARQLWKRSRFLEMMLESNDVEKTTMWTLGLIFLVLLTPRVFRMFNKPAREFKARPPLVYRKGFPF